MQKNSGTLRAFPVKTSMPKTISGKEKVEGFDVTGRGLGTKRFETKAVALVNNEIDLIKTKKEDAKKRDQNLKDL